MKLSPDRTRYRSGPNISKAENETRTIIRITVVQGGNSQNFLRTLGCYYRVVIFLLIIFQVFKTVLTSIQEQNPEYYVKLMAPLKKADLTSVQVKVF